MTVGKNKEIRMTEVGIRYMHKCIKILATNADKRYASGNLTEK